MESTNLRTGIVVKLEAKTKGGKDSISQQGSKWLIEAISERVMFDERNGIWLGLRANSSQINCFRWVHLTEDENFKVIIK